jgi:hypothetical protein
MVHRKSSGIIFPPAGKSGCKEKICAVLAGYVWNKDNPFVKKHDTVIKNLANLIKLEKQEQQNQQ